MEQIGQMSQSPCGGKRIAFFGGSFDPPHQGHLAVARAARAALGLDSVLFAPVGVQPLKSQGSTASFPDRLAMTSRAIAGEAGFAVSLIDAPKPSATPNYTLDTLLRLRSELPSDGRLFCLMGADSFFGLHLWHRAAEIPFVAPLIVASRPAASRPGQPLDDLRAALPQGLKPLRSICSQVCTWRSAHPKFATVFAMKLLLSLTPPFQDSSSFPLRYWNTSIRAGFMHRAPGQPRLAHAQ
jgi:nicotinate (nicotinamide) nucleotide adenylyltransferase